MDKQKLFNEMIRIAACSNCYDNVERAICYDKPKCRTKEDIGFAIVNLVKAGYGNISQALTDFVTKLNERLEKDTDNIARDYDIMRYKKITTIVNETLEEFKNEYKI